MTASVTPKNPQDKSKDARFHRVASWLIFIVLLITVFLPAQYSLFPFAFPFGTVAIGLYYYRFRTTADLEAGLAILLLVIGLQAVTILRSGYQARETAAEVRRLVCESDQSETLCDEVYSVLYPEPAENDNEF